MDAKNQQKLLDAGFTIVRAQAQQKNINKWSCSIKVKTMKQREWTTLENDFESKAGMERRMKELLVDAMVVED